MGGGGDCPEGKYEVLRHYKSAADWLNCSAVELMDRGDPELIAAAEVAARAESDYLDFLREQALQKAKVRK